MKSLSVRPSILWVHKVISALPQASKMSGWWPCASASSPTRFTKASACLKSGNLNCRTMWCSLATCHSVTSLWRAANSCPLSGGTPPRQGTQVLDASEAMKFRYTQDGLSVELDAKGQRLKISDFRLQIGLRSRMTQAQQSEICNLEIRQSKRNVFVADGRRPCRCGDRLMLGHTLIEIVAPGRGAA